MSGGAAPDPAAYPIDGKTPEQAWRPGSSEEVAALLAEASAAGQVVVPQGGRTALSLGRPLDRYDVALDLSGLDSAVAYEPDDVTVTVGAGMSLRALQSMLAEYGQYLPIDPPPDGRVSIGGLLATARPGAWRGQLPAARDLLLGATVATPSGELVRTGGRVVKNVSGYDLHRLHTGALGVFGVIVEASFKLATLPPGTRTLAVPRERIEDASALALELRELGLPLRALSVLSPQAAAVAGLEERPHALLETMGDEAVLDRCSAAIGERAGGAAIEPPAGAWERLRALAGGERGVVLRLGVPTSEVAATMEAIEATGDGNAGDHGGIVTWGHLTAGSVIAAGGAIEASDVLALRARAEQRGGFLQIEAGPPELRTEAEPFGEGERALVRALRRQFDPGRTINRGRWEAES